MSKKIRIFLLGCALMIASCMGLMAGAAEETKAELIAHNLTITESGINVNFYVDIQDEDVEVILNENEVDKADWGNEVSIVVDAKAYTCYKFTQPVVAKKMNDNVSLIVNSGNDQILKDDYSVNQYVDEVTAQDSGYGYNLEKLAEAMTYYGEFSEVYFGYDGKSDADPEAEQYIADGFDEEEKQALQAYAMTKGNDYPTGLTYYGTQLNLNSEITLRLCFEIEEGRTADDYGHIYADEIDLGELKKGSYGGTQYYYVDIKNIGAADLDESYTIKSGEYTLLSHCSVLSYARAVIYNYATDASKTNLVNVSKALYLYNQMADTYVASQATAVYDIFYGSEGFSATPDEFKPVYLTSNGDVTTESAENTQVKTLVQLKDSRTKGCSVWMQVAYTVSDNEALTGPYVIRRYANNTGNILNVTGTATVQTKIDGSCGDFVAQYPNDTQQVTFPSSTDTVTNANSMVNVAADASFTIAEGGIIQNSHVKNGEVYVSGNPVAFNVNGDAKSGVITVDAAAKEVCVNAEGLTAAAEVTLASHDAQELTGNGEASVITLKEDGVGHFGVVKEDNNLRIASIICVCGVNVSEHVDSCAWISSQDEGLAAVYDIDWKPWNGAISLENHESRVLPRTGSYYLTADFTLNNTSTLIDATVNLDLAGHTVTSTQEYIYSFNDNGTLNIADSSKDKIGKILCSGALDNDGYNGRIIYVIAGRTSARINLYGGVLGEVENSGNTSSLVNLQNGIFNVYDGDILLSDTNLETVKDVIRVGTTANAASATLNVNGGSIEGDVLLVTEKAKINISGSAKIGVYDESGKSCGIYAPSTLTTAPKVECTNVAAVDGGKNIVLKDERFVALSGTGEGSAFEISENLHNKVVDENGTLKFAARMCNCGALEDGAHKYKADGTKACAMPEEAWKPWNATISKATDSSGRVRAPWGSGSYYLTEDIVQDDVTSEVTASASLDLDLAGHQLSMIAEGNRVYSILKYAILNITDSVSGGRFQFPAGSTHSEPHLIWLSGQTCSLNLFGGSLTAEGGSTTASTAYLIKRSKGQVYWYGGNVIQTNSIKHYNDETTQNGTKFFNIIGEGLEVKTVE